MQEKQYDALKAMHDGIFTASENGKGIKIQTLVGALEKLQQEHPRQYEDLLHNKIPVKCALAVGILRTTEPEERPQFWNREKERREGSKSDDSIKDKCFIQ